MHYITCLLALCITATIVPATEPQSIQLSSSEKPRVGKQGTQNPEAYALYLIGAQGGAAAVAKLAGGGSTANHVA